MPATADKMEIKEFPKLPSPGLQIPASRYT